MALWTKFGEARRDKIKPGWKPIMRDHGHAGWTCHRDGWIGYGDTAEAAWSDLWATYFTAKGFL